MKTFLKQKINGFAGIAICVVLISSCVATNNMYVNNPEPIPKGEADVYVAIGTGLEARLDSNFTGGSYVTGYKTQIAPVFSFGGQLGISKNFNLRGAVHLPYALGGFGFRLGGQYSLFDANSAFNAAFGTDLGFAFTRDSLLNSDIESDARGMYNVDVYMPLGYSFTEDISIILTTRYTYTWISVDDIYNAEKARHFKSHYPIFSLGLMVKGLHLESSVLLTPKKLYPQFGLGFVFEI